MHTLLSGCLSVTQSLWPHPQGKALPARRTVSELLRGGRVPARQQLPHGLHGAGRGRKRARPARAHLLPATSYRFARP